MGRSESRLLPLILAAVILFAGWWVFVRSPGSGGSTPQLGPGVLGGGSKATPDLLQASQMGSGYDQDATGTRATSSADIRKGQSPQGLSVIASSWKDGAQASWYQPAGSITVTSRAEVFTSDNLGPVSDALERLTLAAYHGHTASPPGSMPGSDGWYIEGTTISPIVSSFPARREVAAYGWREGDVLAIVVVTGLHSDDAPDAVVKLAKAQDANIRFAGS
jgi:hypothetical protein